MPDRTGCTSRLRGEGGGVDSVDPGELWWSIRKYSGLTKPAATSELEGP